MLFKGRVLQTNTVPPQFSVAFSACWRPYSKVNDPFASECVSLLLKRNCPLTLLLSLGLGSSCCPSGEEHPPRPLSPVEGWCSACLGGDESREVGFITTLM